jgi:hypothetical protein
LSRTYSISCRRGGTGEYRDARGEGQQTMPGLNATEAVNLQVKLDVSKR